MIKFFKLLTVLISLGTASVYAQQSVSSSVSMFPKAEKGQVQYIIDVPHSDKDNLKKIEFFVGKVMETDGCNSYGLAGQFEEKDLQGWGYNYYVFTTNGSVRSTMMACPDAKKIQQFVSSESKMARYNGRLPIVIYAPEGYEVRYKIYTTDEETFIGKTVK
ncbi:ecotin [Sphingobacterium spiritivorum]|uniref:ecotin n=1 Tax=Sphingobacterium TaxID=28453 RepID=UPI0025D29955|nr:MULTISPECIES: ecotin family protein [unclassified Sphingobacterium]